MSVHGMPHSIPWGGRDLKVGTIVKWLVSVWDGKGVGPAKSDYTKFGVGPETWTGEWMTHPNDVTNLAM